MTTASNRMLLSGIEFDVYLGWSDLENQQLQRVSIDIAMHLPHDFKATLSDSLADTYCYDKLITLLEKKITPRKFRLLEYLSHEIYLLIKQNVSAATKISVRVKKFPAIKNLKSGVSFSCGDEDNVW